MAADSTAITGTVAWRPLGEAPAGRGAVLAALLASASGLALLLAPSAARAQATIDNGDSVTVPGTQSSPWTVGGPLYVGVAWEFLQDCTLRILKPGWIKAVRAQRPEAFT